MPDANARQTGMTTRPSQNSRVRKIILMEYTLNLGAVSFPNVIAAITLRNFKRPGGTRG